jgi:membrane-associated phospholipid phosphatase
MTAADRLTARIPWPFMVARRTAGNITAWIAAMGRPARVALPRFWPPTSRLTIGTAATIVAVAIAMLFLDPLTVHARRLPLWVFVLFDEFTDFGKAGWVLLPTGMMLLALAAVASPALGRTSYLVLTSLVVRIGFVFVAVGLPSLVVTIVKRLIGRARPLRVDGYDIYFAPFSWRVDYASMPSGHSTTAFATVVALGALFPRARIALWAYGALIAASRVILTAHYPSDVITGAVVGGCGAVLIRAWFASRRLGFVLAPDGAVRVLPGPSLQRIKKVARRLASQ